MYAVFLHFVDTFPRFRLRKPRVALAFFTCVVYVDGPFEVVGYLETEVWVVLNLLQDVVV
jgi:hypothetical protein